PGNGPCATPLWRVGKEQLPSRRVRSDGQRMNENENYDVVVVGGGAAGLSGAVALARSRRSVLVVDAGDPRNAPAGHVHNFLSRDGTPPSELYAAGRAEVRRYGGRVEIGRVAALARDGERFGVQISAQDGERFGAQDGEQDGEQG